MALSTPTVQSVSDGIIAQVEASIAQTIPILPRSFTRVLAKALGGLFILIYKYAGFIFLQLFVKYASFRDTTINGTTINPLIEWGRLVGLGDPDPGERAELTVTVTVTNQTGSISAGQQLVFPDTGVIYLVTSAVELDAPTVPVNIRAYSDQDGNGGIGDIGNLQNGDIVTFANPLPNIARDAVVAATVTTGADAEDEDTYRDRVIRRFQARPQGGAYADYRVWAESVSGIIHAYPYTGDPGEVDIYVEATEASSGSPDGIPTAPQLTAVADAIDLDSGGLATRRPANAAINVLAITRTGFDITVSGLSADDVDSAKTALEAAADEYLRSREPFIVGLSVLPRLNRITEAAVGGVIVDTVEALGGSVNTVEVFLSAVPTPSYTLAEGEKAKAGTFTYA